MKIDNRYIPFKFLQKILFKISRESNGFDLSKLNNEKCSICGRKTGDFYELPPTPKNKAILKFKVKLQYHKFNNSSKIIIICHGCHLKYHLIEKIDKINPKK
jgi:hypothetical protein